MKIGYIDLYGTENYSITPNSYGGGQIVASFSRMSIPNFHIFAQPQSFNDIEEKDRENCHSITTEVCDVLKRGERIKKYISDAGSFDLFFHHHCSHFLNLEELKAKQGCWIIGYLEKTHPQLEHLCFFNFDYQKTTIKNPKAKIYHVQLGKPIPEFQVYKKQDYLFQCSRQCNVFSSKEVANMCQRNNIPIIFGGPIDKEYEDFLDYIDGNITKYVGILPYKEKIEYTKYARASTLCHSWNTPFTLGGLESLAYGTPLITTSAGFWPTFITPRIGKIISNEQEFVKAYYDLVSINQLDCYNKASEFSSDKMVESFKKAFENILNS